MRTPIFLLFILLLVSCSRSGNDRAAELQELYVLLDTEIANSNKYEKEKNDRIIAYKREYDLSTDKFQRTALINKLIEEFNAYNADSALHYISYNLQRPAVIATPGEQTRLLIKRADVYAHAGLFSDALNTMQSIPRDSLTPALLESYYATYCALYQYLSEYTTDHEPALIYEKQRSAYADSLSRVIDTGSFNHLVFVMTEMARNGESEKAIEALSRQLEDYPSGTREYSILASTLAYIYKTAGFPDDYKRYLALSAISDVRGAVKENMSFREVATVMFEDGDVDRANRYLKKSIADANFYSALMRNAQSSKMLPVIDEAYAAVQNDLTDRLRTMVWVSSILSVILLVTIFLILKQFRSLHKAKDKVSLANEELRRMSERLREANNELKEKNDDLSAMSEELRQTNAALEGKNGELSLISEQLKSTNIQLAARNAELRDFNHTKEQYAGLFMEYCSSAISSLQHYQQSLRKLTVQGGNRAALLKKLESTEIADQLLKNFYVRFDEAILNIYPSFVGKFNALLNPGEQVVLKSGELLNTELRLYALIRIGIDDSAKIADFLRCSISTVYTYRSKMRKRAINPDEFENEVRNLD
ncbi:MAG: hypothetical protein K2J27_06010 [Duncaniella sp.]|nr:hypothetical protein [Duncaniella sp.]